MARVGLEEAKTLTLLLARMLEEMVRLRKVGNIPRRPGQPTSRQLKRLRQRSSWKPADPTAASTLPACHPSEKAAATKKTQ